MAKQDDHDEKSRNWREPPEALERDCVSTGDRVEGGARVGTAA